MKKILLAVLLAVFACTAFTGVSMATSSTAMNNVIWQDWCYIGDGSCESWLATECGQDPLAQSCGSLLADEHCIWGYILYGGTEVTATMAPYEEITCFQGVIQGGWCCN